VVVLIALFAIPIITLFRLPRVDSVNISVAAMSFVSLFLILLFHWFWV
jgi:hypothetical protein